MCSRDGMLGVWGDVLSEGSRYFLDSIAMQYSVICTAAWQYKNGSDSVTGKRYL